MVVLGLRGAGGRAWQRRAWCLGQTEGVSGSSRTRYNCTTVLPSLLQDSRHSSGVVARWIQRAGTPDNNELDKCWYLSSKLCSSVKHSPKHHTCSRPRQHADAGFRGWALSGESLIELIELILGGGCGWPAGKAKHAQWRAVPRAGPMVSFHLCFRFYSRIRANNSPKDGMGLASPPEC